LAGAGNTITTTARNGFGLTATGGATPLDQTVKSDPTAQMNTTNRYNPVKFLKDPKKALTSENITEDNNNEDAEDGSTGGHTATNTFYQKDYSNSKREIVPMMMPVPTMIPDKMTSAVNVYNTISSKVDPIK
jgi:hypothetical protein